MASIGPVGPRCQGLCSLRSRGPPNGGQDSDRVSHRCSAPYTLSRFAGLPLKGKRGIWREKQASHILHIPFRCIPPLVPYGTTFPPQFGGAAKGKRLNGQARRLTSPHLEVLCRTSTGDYKAPLCCELLMKGLLFRTLFFPLNRGKSGAARIGGGERSEPISRIVFHAR